MSDIEKQALSPLLTMGRTFLVTAFGLGAAAVLTLAALYIYNTEGLPPTTMEPPGYWGVHLTNYVYFISLGFGIALISAYLWVRKTNWAAFSVRLADISAVMAFVVAAFHLLFQIGTMQGLVDHILYAQPNSPYLWDGVLVIFLFITTIISMYMPLVPDMVRASLNVKEIKAFYRVLAFGYIGNPIQRIRVQKYSLTAAYIVIFVLVTMVTVIAWGFEEVNPHPVWNHAITGPLFIAEALVIGIAALIGMLAILRKLGNYEQIMPTYVFVKLGKGLMVAILVYMGFLFAETMTRTYEVDGTSVDVANMVWVGEYAPITWGIIFFGLVIPFLLIMNPRLQTHRPIVVAATMTTVVMWFKTYMVVVPGLTKHLQPIEGGIYIPSLVESVLMVGSFAFFAILMVSMSRFFPMVSIWEVEDAALTDEELEVVAG
jgi:molybdopterin-containing oxidoreductase family membrane subunit